MPRVSVVCASYNHERFVEAALRSVLAQDFQDFEIVLTDDGSADATVAAIQAVRDPRISLVELPRNLGACVALNNAVLRARGEYVAVLNSDDLFLPGKLGRQVAILDARPEIAAVFGLPQFIDETGAPLAADAQRDNALVRAVNQSRHAWLRQLFVQGNALCHPSVLIRRAIYDEVGLYNPAMAQLPDMEFWVRLLLRHEIHLMPEPVVGFRKLANQANASGPRPDVLVRDAWEMRRVLEHYLELSEADFERVFPEVAERDRGLPMGWRVGSLALSLGRPQYVLFGLDAMYTALPGIPDPLKAREFIALTGAFDPFALLSNLTPDRRMGRPTIPPPPKRPEKGDGGN